MSAARYMTTQDATATPRDIELRAFRTVNGMLAAATDRNPLRAAALHKAHRMWSILLGDLLSPASALPDGLRANLISLGLWAQRECIARLGDEGTLEPLLALHRDLIEGLQAQADRSHHAAVPPQGLGAISA